MFEQCRAVGDDLMTKTIEEIGMDIYNDLKADYAGVEKVDMETKNTFRIYADDDTLWNIFGDTMKEFTSIEFDAGAGEKHFLKVII